MVIKAVLLLTSLTCVLGNSWFDDFSAGFTRGKSEPIDCVSSPTGCLETLGRGLGLVASGEWSKPAQHVKSALGTDPNIAQFFSGFIEGIMVNPAVTNSCTTQVYTWIQLIGMLASLNFSDMSVLQIINVGCSVYTQFSVNLLDACNIPELLHALQTLSLYDYLVSYLDNNCSVNAAITAVSECGQDYYDCGYSAGVIVRLETGWSI